jgi:hypothetical protein
VSVREAVRPWKRVPVRPSWPTGEDFEIQFSWLNRGEVSAPKLFELARRGSVVAIKFFSLSLSRKKEIRSPEFLPVGHEGRTGTRIQDGSTLAPALTRGRIGVAPRAALLPLQNSLVISKVSFGAETKCIFDRTFNAENNYSKFNEK